MTRVLLALLFLISGRMRAQSILVPPSSLGFTAIAQGEPPSPQQIPVISQDGTSIEFAVRVDGGDPATPAPSWISLNATRALTPARLLVSVNPTGLAAGAQGTARVLLTTPAGVLLLSPIAVSLRVNDAPPRLMAAPDFLRFTGRAGGASTPQQFLLVWNAGGGGPLSSVQAAVSEGGPWLRVETGTCARDCPVKVTAGVAGLQRGYYRGVVRITSAIGTRDVPVTLDMYDRVPILTLATAGTSFETRQGSGWPETRRIPVFNSGDAGVTWTAEVLRGREWLSIPNSLGAAAVGTPGVLPLNVNASTVAAGTYYGLVRLTSPEAVNSPQYFVAVLRVNATSAPAVPEFSQAGLIFVGQSGAADPPSQPVAMYASTSGASYQASAMIAETGASWLSATPSRASVSTASPAQILVAAGTGALRAGVYNGSIVFAIGNAPERALNVTAVVTPPGAEQCVTRRAVVVQSALLDSFAARVGVPQALAVRAVNDCGTLVRDAQAIVSFSSPDEPAVTLLPAGDGTFTGTWTPRAAAASIAVTARVSTPDLDAGFATVVGSVAESNAPMLVSGGVVNNLNPVRAGALAPGTVAQVYGQNLAATTAQPPLVGGRLPTAASGTTITVGAIDAPLYYLSPGQVNAQVPFDLAPNRTYSVVACTADACATPDQISVAATSPGIAAFSDGRAIAQDTDFRLIDATNPARRGDYVVLYLTGLGATNPVVASGLLSPRNPLAQVTAAPQVVIDGRPAEVFFAGLTPDFVGLYQINVRVPADTAAGSARIIVIQAGAASNEVTLPVR